MQKGCEIFYKNGRMVANKWQIRKKEGRGAISDFLNILSTKLIQLYFKDCIYYIFQAKKGFLCPTRRNVFYFSNQKLRKSKFGNVDIQTPRLHEMPKHKTANTFY